MSSKSKSKSTNVRNLGTTYAGRVTLKPLVRSKSTAHLVAYVDLGYAESSSFGGETYRHPVLTIKRAPDADGWSGTTTLSSVRYQCHTMNEPEGHTSPRGFLRYAVNHGSKRITGDARRWTACYGGAFSCDIGGGTKRASEMLRMYQRALDAAQKHTSALWNAGDAARERARRITGCELLNLITGLRLIGVTVVVDSDHVAKARFARSGMSCAA